AGRAQEGVAAVEPEDEVLVHLTGVAQADVDAQRAGLRLVVGQLPGAVRGEPGLDDGDARAGAGGHEVRAVGLVAVNHRVLALDARHVTARRDLGALLLLARLLFLDRRRRGRLVVLGLRLGHARSGLVVTTAIGLLGGATLGFGGALLLGELLLGLLLG